MISEQLFEELKNIFKTEYHLDLNDQEIRVIGNQLISSYETLIKLFKEKHFEETNN